MKRSLLIAIPALILYSSLYGQHLEYSQVFAPSEDLVKPAERPLRQDLCLNGSWQFQPVSLPAGFREGIDAAPALPAAGADWEQVLIRIPSPWNVNSFADNKGQGGDFRTFPGYPKSWENIKMGWLRKKFSVPAGWKGQRIILHFDAVAGDAEIQINDRAAGKHFGIFLPFELDVTDLIRPGKENEIRIGIRKASLFDKRGNYGRRTYQGGSFWGQHIAGIWQDVYLVSVAPVHVSDVYIRPLLGADTLVAEVTVVNDQDRSAGLSIDAKVFRWLPGTNASTTGDPYPSSSLASAVSLPLPAVMVNVPAHGKIKVMLSTAVKGRLKSWTPEDPELYGLVVGMRVNGKHTDNKYTRFGWREVTLQGGKVLLNGTPVIMKGDSWHFLGIPQMTRRYAAAWFRAVKDAHLNAVRLHAQPYPSFYLDVADEMGILVLDETAIWASDGGPKLNDPDFWSDTKDHLSGLILRDRNHPSIFGWSVSNEVMPIVTGVFRNPPGMKDTLLKYYGIWEETCRMLDPGRSWISADGEDDGQGRFPAWVVHYGGADAMERGKKSGKPWGVGEAGNAYYGTPEQVSESNGDRAYESFLGRMEGVAISSYQSLVLQREKDAVYRSVFNMVWYGLKPLPLGLRDTTKAPSPDDGVYFTSFKEGVSGVQPQRLGPYCTTLNPGYDPSLPLYQTWPLFDAIRDASSEPLAGVDKWVVKRSATPAGPATAAQPAPPSTGYVKPVRPLKVIGGNGSVLAKELKRTGLPSGKLDTAQYLGKTSDAPEILFLDGIHVPGAESRSLIDAVLAKGGTVIVWGVGQTGLPALNSLLPAELEITSRSSSSLLPVTEDKIIAGIGAADLYFSESRPAEIITNGLSGALVRQSTVLLAAAATDWLKWNKQPEYAKTGMVVRSEREAHPSGVALISKEIGNGRLIVTTLPAAPRLAKAEKLVRRILANLGIPLDAGNDAGKPLLKDGNLVRALYCGNFPVAFLQDGAIRNLIDPLSGEQMRSGANVGGKTWSPVFNENGLFEPFRNRGDGARTNGVGYLSFWVSSPRSLEDLLAEPDIPVVNMEVAASNAVQVYLNGKMIIDNIRSGNIEGGKAGSAALKLHQGWNHFLIKLIQPDGRWQFSGQLTSNQPDFLAELESSMEKP
ncbi:MAG TPA: glycoside hydrolase family 2 TIM barrel-domain containing protein [Puia sp.]|nr:glycoside hydrolase family 2 TIM barrel-domain containing protein [Puia sp.]